MHSKAKKNRPAVENSFPVLESNPIENNADNEESQLQNVENRFLHLFPAVQPNCDRLGRILQEMENRLMVLEHAIPMGTSNLVKKMEQSVNINGIATTENGAINSLGTVKSASKKSPWSMMEAPPQQITPAKVQIVKIDGLKLEFAEQSEADVETDKKDLWCLQKQLDKVLAAVNEMASAFAHKTSLQDARDKAQDEIVNMEMETMHREIARCAQLYEQEEFQHAIEERIAALEAQIRENLISKMRHTEERVDSSITKVVKQVAAVMQSVDLVSQVQEERFNSLAHSIKKDVLQAILRERNVFEVSMGGGSTPMHASSDKEQASFAGMLPGGGLENPFTQLKKQQATLQKALDALKADATKVEEMVRVDRQALNSMQTSVELLGTGIETNLLTQIEKAVKAIKAQNLEDNLTLEGSVKHAKQEAKHDLAVLKQQLERSIAEHEKAGQERDLRLRNKVESECVHRLSSLEEQLHSLSTNMVKELQSQAKSVESEMRHLQEKLQTNLSEATAGLNERVRDLRLQADTTQYRLEKGNTEFTKKLDEMKEGTTSRFEGHEKVIEALRKDVQSIVAQNAADSKRLNATIETLQKQTNETLELIEASNEEQKLNFEKWMDKMELLMTGHHDTNIETCRRLERSNVAIAVLVRKFEQDLNAMMNKEHRWDLLDTQWQAFAKAIGEKCINWESAATSDKPLSFSPQQSRFLIQMGWRCAKMIAMRSDFEVSREVLLHSKPEDEEWDYKVSAARVSHANAFLGDVTKYCRKTSPSPDLLAQEARGVYLKKVEICLKLALSKNKALQVGATLFGRVKLEQVCAACDRPFAHAGNITGGDKRGATNEGGAHLRHSRVTQQRKSDASASASSLIEEGAESSPIGSTGSFMASDMSVNSVDSKVQTYGKSGQKYVYRGGFKIPKKSTTLKLGLEVGENGNPDSGSVSCPVTPPHLQSDVPFGSTDANQKERARTSFPQI